MGTQPCTSMIIYMRVSPSSQAVPQFPFALVSSFTWHAVCVPDQTIHAQASAHPFLGSSSAGILGVTRVEDRLPHYFGLLRTTSSIPSIQEDRGQAFGVCPLVFKLRRNCLRQAQRRRQHAREEGTAAGAARHQFMELGNRVRGTLPC